MANLKELEERIGRVEQEVFGFTLEEAREYLGRASENMKRMGEVEFDNFCSRNLETMRRAEKCVGA